MMSYCTGDKRRDPETTMALYDNLQDFRPETEDIGTYLERVDLYFIANSTPADKQVPIFFNILGPAVYGLLRSLVAPDEPKRKSLVSLKDALRKHYEPKMNTVAERFFFHRRNQHAGETVADYLAYLRMLSLWQGWPFFLVAGP